MKDWIQGARPRTLPAAVVPVLVGTACAAGERAGGLVWWRAAAAMVVALALQIATNYANDYSDGSGGPTIPAGGSVRCAWSGGASSRRRR